jgi:hypothetical protein
LREIHPSKKKTQNSGPNIGAIAGELLNKFKTIVTFLTSSDTLIRADSNSSKNAFGVMIGSNNSCTPSLINSSFVTPVQQFVGGIGASFGTGTGTGTGTDRDTLLLLVLTLLLLPTPSDGSALFLLATLLTATPRLLVGKVAAPPPAVAIARCVVLTAVKSINALADDTANAAIGPFSRTLSEPESI